MLKILELYSGIGGMHSALLESGVDGQIVASIDINTNANNVYKHNFSKTPNLNRNIQNLKPELIKNLGINAIFMSPPCQPFTRNGLQKDKLDNRTSSLFHVMNLITQTASIKYILVENVRGFENSVTRNELVSCLKNSDYDVKEFLLSPYQFGIPNSRQRYYLIAKRKAFPFIFSNEHLIEELPVNVKNILPENRHEILAEKDNKINLRTDTKCYTLEHILESDVQEQYMIPLEILKKRWSVLDIRNKESNGSCCFTKAYYHYLEGTGSVYCPLTENKMKNIFNELENLDESDERYLDLLASLKLRYFTPREVSRLMCFSENFSFPDNITEKQKYKLLGNSINVFVVSRLIYLLCCEKIVET